MIWFTWRQFRTQTWVTVGALALLGVVLVITGLSIADAYDTNVGGCQTDCANAISNFLNEVRSGAGGKVYDLTLPVLYVVPALIGIFWGAPLIARELETGTHRLAWTQSVTRARWLATKIGVAAATVAATTGVLSWAVTAWAHHIDHANADRITPLVYGARGIVPIGYALFALTLGVTAGMLIRRTVPAMAATLAVYVVTVVAMAEWIREHLMPARHITSPLEVNNLDGLMINPGTGRMRVFAGTPDNAWVLSNQAITSSGDVFNGPVNMQYCGPEHGPRACAQWLGTLGLREDITYQPASHFWPLQWIETGVLVAAAAALTAFCFWWLRRRVS
jgi:ABC-2 family transporter protein